MSLAALESTVPAAFDARDGISTSTKGEVREAVDHALELLDKGETRVAERGTDGKWKVNQWLKKAVLLSFRLNDMGPIPGGARLNRAPLGLHRPQRRLDAVLRQSRRLCR